MFDIFLKYNFNPLPSRYLQMKSTFRNKDPKLRPPFAIKSTCFSIKM